MKKSTTVTVIVTLVTVAVIALGAFFIYKGVIMNPERLIVGKWINDSSDSLSYTFNEDGSMSGNVELPVMGKVSINGTYTMDKEAGTIDIIYELVGISHTDVKKFVIEDGHLTLTDESLGITSSFTKEEK